MTLKKKYFAALLGAAFMACLAGCGNTGSSTADAGAKKEVSQEVSSAENDGGDAAEQAKSDTEEPAESQAAEQDENARPELLSHIENLEDYDTIFVGYPNWWADLPMVLYSFFDEYDFSGKTIIPFNVHNGSRFSGTIDTIQELEPEANVVTDGFTVSESVVAEAASDVADWLRGLGY